MLLKVKKFIMEKKSVTLDEMSLFLGQSPETTAALLDFLVRKHIIKKKPSTQVCKGACSMCPMSNTCDVYEWN